MADSDALGVFIRAAKERGIADDALVALLRQHGWSDRRAYQALSDYYEATLGQPIPSRGSRIEQARDAFLYLLAFITLGFWVVGLIFLADNLVDRSFPSPLDYGLNLTYYRHEAAGFVASLIIAFPLYLFVSWLISQELTRRPEAFESGVRKWLTYIALVLTATALICDAVAFLSDFLTGDLTLRFALKASVLFVVAAGVFWYYLGNVRAEASNRVRDRWFAGAAVASVAVALVFGFSNIGSPGYERAESLDGIRVDNLRAIAQAMHERWNEQKKSFALPTKLSDLNVSLSGLRDPSTRSAYPYVPMAGSKYRLCATFSMPSTSVSGQDFWTHTAGSYCFDLDAQQPAPPTQG